MVESYCRQCGTFLPDVSKLIKPEIPPEEHFQANTILSGMTVLVSFILSFLLFLMLGFKGDTHPLIYVTGGLLIAIGCWHVQAFIRTQILKNQWERRYGPRRSAVGDAAPTVKSSTTARSLNEANLSNAIPASVTENTTRHLVTEPNQKPDDPRH